MLEKYLKNKKSLNKIYDEKYRMREALSGNTGIVFHLLTIIGFSILYVLLDIELLSLLNSVKQDINTILLQQGDIGLFYFYLSDLSKEHVWIQEGVVQLNTSFWSIKETTNELELLKAFNIGKDLKMNDSVLFLFWGLIFLPSFICIRIFLTHKAIKDNDFSTFLSLLLATIIFSSLIWAISSDIQHLSGLEYVSEVRKYGSMLFTFSLVSGAFLIEAFYKTFKNGFFSLELYKALNKDAEKMEEDIKSNLESIFSSEKEMKAVVETFESIDQKNEDYEDLKELMEEFKAAKAVELEKKKQVDSTLQAIDGYFQSNKTEEKNIMHND